MKLNLRSKIVFLILFSVSILEANQLLSSDLQNKINVDLSQKLEKKFDKYNKDVESQKKIIVDTLGFINLYEKDLYLPKTKTITKKIVINEFK